MGEKVVGKVTHFFSKIGVAAIEITDGELKVGDTIRIKGASTDFQQPVDSMQLDNAAIEKAVPGNSVGIKATDAARKNDAVYVVTED
ncbi:MAG: hypothetical protein ABIH66_05365 [bacterium]